MSTIPKRAFFYWGNNPLDFIRFFTLYSFRKFHPDWEIVLLRNPNTVFIQKKWETWEVHDSFSYSGFDYCKWIDKLGICTQFVDIPVIFNKDTQISDVHLKDLSSAYYLSTVGGVAVDTDIIFFRPIDEDIGGEFNVCLTKFSANYCNGYIPVTLMCGASSNLFFSDVFKLALNNYNPTDYQSCGNGSVQSVMDKWKLNYNHLAFKKLSDFIIYPFFYKYGFDEMIKLLWYGDISNDIHKESCGIHWYGGCPVSLSVHANIDHNNYSKYNNTICNLIKKIGFDL